MGAKFIEPCQFERLEADPNAVPDGFGGQEKVWTEFYDCRAWVRETPGKEKLAGGLLDASATATLRVWCSRSAAIREATARDRVIVRGHIWDIKAAPIDPDGRGAVIEFLLQRQEATQ